MHCAVGASPLSLLDRLAGSASTESSDDSFLNRFVGFAADAGVLVLDTASFRADAAVRMPICIRTSLFRLIRSSLCLS